MEVEKTVWKTGVGKPVGKSGSENGGWETEVDETL
jgi:hypothetical protein